MILTPPFLTKPAITPSSLILLRYSSRPRNSQNLRAFLPSLDTEIQKEKAINQIQSGLINWALSIFLEVGERREGKRGDEICSPSLGLRCCKSSSVWPMFAEGDISLTDHASANGALREENNAPKEQNLRKKQEKAVQWYHGLVCFYSQIQILKIFKTVFNVKIFASFFFVPHFRKKARAPRPFAIIYPAMLLYCHSDGNQSDSRSCKAREASLEVGCNTVLRLWAIMHNFILIKEFKNSQSQSS